MLDSLFYALAALALAAGWLTFRARSAVRAAFLLLCSFLSVAMLMLLLEAEFLAGITMLVILGEMVVMALFAVAFTLNPGGLNPPRMVHQPRLAAAVAITVFVVLAISIRSAKFPIPLAQPLPDPTVALGRELLGASVLIFETVGVLLLTATIAVVAIAARRGRFRGGATVKRGQPRVAPPQPAGAGALDRRSP